MKKQTIKITKKHLKDTETEGYLYNYKGIDLIVHKNLSGYTGYWTVSEHTTGLRVLMGSYPTKKEAIEIALSTIDQRGIDNIKSIIKKQLHYFLMHDGDLSI